MIMKGLMLILQLFLNLMVVLFKNFSIKILQFDKGDLENSIV